jgi:hypothetical protein
MAVMHAARARGLAFGVETEDDLHDLAPVGSFLSGVQEPQVGLEMALVIGRDVRLVGGKVFEDGDGYGCAPELVCTLDVRRSCFGLIPVMHHLTFRFESLVALRPACPIESEFAAGAKAFL